MSITFVYIQIKLIFTQNFPSYLVMTNHDFLLPFDLVYSRIYKKIRDNVRNLFKGSPEGRSDQEFRGSILCDVIEIS